MSTADPINTALLIIDYQQAFNDAAFWGARNNPEAEANAARLLLAFRKAGRPVIHIVHNSIMPGSPLAPNQAGNAEMAFVRAIDGEPIIGKSVNSAFIGTDLETRLRTMRIEHLVIMGVTTDHCVSTTTRMAANLGFKVTLAGDACFTFDRKDAAGETIPAETVQRVELAILAGEFADVTTAAAIVETLV